MGSPLDAYSISNSNFTLMSVQIHFTWREKVSMHRMEVVDVDPLCSHY